MSHVAISLNYILGIQQECSNESSKGYVCYSVLKDCYFVWCFPQVCVPPMQGRDRALPH